MDKKIELKATGETITFTKSTADFAEMIVTLPASGDGPPTHRHVLQTEIFEAIDGAAIKFKATFTPALSIEYLLTEMFDACNRQNAKDPSAFDACYILRQAKGEYYLGEVPPFIQQTIFPMTAIFGKLFGLVKAKPKSV